MRQDLNVLGAKNRIGHRLIVLIIAFSSLITLVITVVQLSFEYHQQRNNMNGELERIEIYIPSITASVWAFDTAQITLALEALSRLPDIDQVAILTNSGGKQWKAGRAPSKHVMTRTYSLRHTVQGKDAEIGTMEVTASLDAIYHRLVGQALSILLSNALKTFLVAGFMVLLFRRLVTERLELLARNAGELVTQMLPDAKHSNNHAHALPEHFDELDAVRWTFDDMARKLRLALDALLTSNEKLQQENNERRQAQKALSDSQSAFRKLASHLVSVREDERKRIARDIHDDLGQNLMVLRIDVSRMAAHPSSMALTEERLAALLGQIDTTIKAVRAIINDLRPGVLDLGLHAALEWQAAEFELRTGIACELQIDHDEFALDDQCATALFRIVQEALSNIVRHAKASLVQIDVRRTGDRLFIRIADDGIGLAAEHPKKPNTFGLVGIEERIDALGGICSIANQPGKGMAIRLSVPISEGNGQHSAGRQT